MKLYWHYVKRAGDGDAFWHEGKRIIARNKDRVGLALKARINVGTEVIDWTDEVLVAGGEVGENNTPKDGEEPRAKKPLPCLLGRNLNQWCAPKCDATEVGKNIVCDDHGRGQDEPDEALENVVDDEMGLTDNEKQGHVCPGKLGELKLVVAFLQGGDEEDESYRAVRQLPII